MSWNDVAADVAHRPYPAPERPWLMTMSWCDLLFAHWPVEPEAMRRAVARACWWRRPGEACDQLPAGLELDLFEGKAWLGVVPFRMENVGFRGLPALPWAGAFAELNVRTYVRAPGPGGGVRPGVFFFSLDAANPLAVRMARMWFNLPYQDARMNCRRDGARVAYESARTHRDSPPAELAASYAPVGPVRAAQSGTLEHWLTERYCLYAVDGTRVLRGDIQHRPWPLRPAEAEIMRNTMAFACGLETSGKPATLHYVDRIDVVAWPPSEVATRGG